MLHAVKPMIWQAMQTLREPNHTEDAIKRSKLQVLSHNLSADGNLPQLVKSFDNYFSAEEDRIESRKYLDTIIHDAVASLQQANKEKEMNICIERVHHVCWELCKVQVTAANSGHYPSHLTETSTKIWWKIFNTFAERDSDTAKMLYPVVMDWEEVDYWVNVLLKVMALPTVSPQRVERQVMGSTALNFQEALQRFNAKINQRNNMYIRDERSEPDVIYIEQALTELNFRLFEGIYLSGALSKVKKGSSTPKWCVLYQLGLGFADSPAEVDKSNPKSFIPIGSGTEIRHLADKSGRPVRFQLKNPKEATPIVFEANNISTRNKWIAAIICMKHGTAPNYEQDSIARRGNRLKNRRYEAEVKQSLLEQRQLTQRQMKELQTQMQSEQQRFKAEAEELRTASKEELQEKVSNYEGKLQSLMEQMQRLGESHEQEKQAIMRQHEEEQDELKRRLGTEMGSVQSQLQNEIHSQSSQITEAAQQRQQLQQQVADLQHQLQQAEEKILQLESRIQQLLEAQRQQLEERVQLEDQLSQLADSHRTELLAKDSQIEQSIAESKSLKEQLTEQQQQQQQQLQELRLESDNKLNSQRQDNEQLNKQLSEQLNEQLTQLQARNRELQSSAEGSQQQLQQLRQKLQEQQQEKQQLESDCEMLPQLRLKLDETSANNEQLQQELNTKNLIIQEKQKELANAVAATNSLQKKYEDLKTGGAQPGHHRGPGFEAQFKN